MTHRALVMSGQGQLTLEERVSTPPGAGEVIVEVIATGICGSDLHGLAGDTGRRSVGQVMGHETVGTVSQAGRGVDQKLIGQLVTVNPVVGCGECSACKAGRTQQCPNGWVLGVRPDVDGAFAERFTIPATNLVPLPAGMLAWHAALVEPLAVGYHATRRGLLQSRDLVVVIGGGPIGQAVALACRREGVRRIVVSEPDPDRAETLHALGFDSVRPAELAAAVEEKLGALATLVIDAVGASATLAAALEVCAPNGRVVVVGMASPHLEFAAYQLSTSERTLIGAFCYDRDQFTSTLHWLADNARVAEIMVDRREPLVTGHSVFSELLAVSRLPNKVLLVADRRQ